MPVQKLSLKTNTNMFGSSAYFESSNGETKFQIGENILYEPNKKLVKKLSSGYLFRSPDVAAEKLYDIWDTIEGFTGTACLFAEYDKKEKELTAYLRISEKSDATMFAFSHSTFEKWSDTQDAEYKKNAKKKKKALNATVNPDGTVKVTVEIEELGD